MVYKRLVFTLLYEDGNYKLSRNFRLQKVGGLDWIRANYNFAAISFSIDELIVLNVAREDTDFDSFASDVRRLSKECFVPLAAGGGVKSLDDAYKLFGANVDRLVVNTALVKAPSLVSLLVRSFGSQAIIGSVDCRKRDGEYYAYVNRGVESSESTVGEAVRVAEDLGVGEIYLTSMDRDGTGVGYDEELIESVGTTTRLPFIVSGGVGKYQHFVEGLKYEHVRAVSTANIYNFVVDGLTKSRAYIESSGIKLARWDHDLGHLHGYFRAKSVGE